MISRSTELAQVVRKRVYDTNPYEWAENPTQGNVATQGAIVGCEVNE